MQPSSFHLPQPYPSISNWYTLGTCRTNILQCFSICLIWPHTYQNHTDHWLGIYVGAQKLIWWVARYSRARCKIFRSNIHVHSNITTVMYFHFLLYIYFLKPTVHDIFCFSTNPGGGSLQNFSNGVQHVMKKWNKNGTPQPKWRFRCGDPLSSYKLVQAIPEVLSFS